MVDYKVSVFNAARDNNVVALKVSSYFSSSSSLFSPVFYLLGVVISAIYLSFYMHSAIIDEKICARNMLLIFYCCKQTKFNKCTISRRVDKKYLCY